MRVTLIRCTVCLTALGIWKALPAGALEEDLRKGLEGLRQELAGLQAKTRAQSAAPVATGETLRGMENKYGPAARVQTARGKLGISGLFQVWFYSIQNDAVGAFGDLTPRVRGGGDSNETRDNDSFRLRRAELKFSLDLTKQLAAVIMFDPARELVSFPGLYSNSGTALRGRTIETSSSVTNVQGGAGTAARMLKDAYVNFHATVPHHDFQLGQFKPPLGEEGIRSGGELDFIERAAFTQLVDFRDLGAMAHGSWWTDGRAQYWIGAFNGSGNFHGSDGGFNDRSDTNDEKDLLLRLLVRPVWNQPRWGNLEFSWSSQWGVHGEAGRPLDTNTNGTVTDALENVDGLGRQRTGAARHYAAGMYKPGGPVKGWWLRGEWAWIKDRNAPAAVRGFPQTSAALIQTSPHPFAVSGWFVSTGYRISESIWKDSAPRVLRSLEFAYRYEAFQNITAGDLVRPKTRTDVFATGIHTAGINYYLKGNNTKIQANYSWVDEPNGNDGSRGLHEVRNSNVAVCCQVSW